MLVAVELDSLSVGALHEVLRTRLGAGFPRPTLIRLWEESGGNPFFALELAVALLRRGAMPTPGEPLPIPATLVELLGERLQSLGAEANEVARVVAATAVATTRLIEAALPDTGEPGLSEALEANIVELEGDRVRFAHPLLGSAVTAHVTPSRRRALHARLAELVPTQEERAWHLAYATSEPTPGSRRSSRRPRGRRAHGEPRWRRRSSRSGRSPSRRRTTTATHDDGCISRPRSRTSPETSRVPKRFSS